MSNKPADNDYKHLVERIGSLLVLGKQKAFQKVNTILVETYWQIGQQIVEFEQSGEERAAYGTGLLKKMSKDLKSKFGKGFSRSNLQNMRFLYLKFPKCQSLTGKLTWTHYAELLSVSDDLAFSFYHQQSQLENWSVRELKRYHKVIL